MIGIGYTNFSSNSGVSKDFMTDSLSTSSTNNIGDVQLVSSSSAVVSNDNIVSNEENTTPVASNSESKIVSNEEKNDNSNYFSQLKMDRDEMYSKSLETYQNIVESSGISSEQKSIAIQEIDKINNVQNSIKVSEELIKLKGFEDVVIYSSNGKISVIVRIAVLSDTQVAQIQNIISKEMGVQISDITISTK